MRIKGGLLNQLASLRKSGDLTGLKKAEVEVRSALSRELIATVSDSIQGWTCPHVEKPAWNYQVRKQAEHFRPRAQAQLRHNIAAVANLLVNPQIAAAILLGVESRLDPQAPTNPLDLSDHEFRRFYRDLKNVATRVSFYTYPGALVTVGWGSGDLAKASSRALPSEPERVVKSMAAAVAQELCDHKKP